MYPSLVIANYFIGLSLQNNDPLTPMKLLKLVYFAHGWYLATYGKPLIDEKIEAWAFGPVIPSIYHAFKKYGVNYITERCLFDGELNKEIKEYLDIIYEEYNKFTAVQLANITHEDGSPWQKIYKKNNQFIPKNAIIEDNSIKTYFELQPTE